MVLSKEQIMQIPKLSAMTNRAIAEKFGVHERTIDYWIKRLRRAGHKVEKKPGIKKIQL